MKICGVALDMDGLLFDTEKLYWAVGDEILIRRGHRFSQPLQDRMMGRVGVAAMQQMIDFHSLDDDPVDLLAESEQLYAVQLGNGPDPMPGLQQWIDTLKQSGLPFGLATSSRRKFVDRILPTVSWAGDLHFILSGDDVTRGKPDPQIYQMAADRMGIDPKTMLVLEDSGNGTAAAVASGAVTVSIPSRHTKNQDFSGAHLVADSLVDPRLLALVDPEFRG
ncbi:Phosphorylated carbohydrates phosphatase [Crateriforma conspicua]|uniref:Phosphorylated carbohydrates phosphatase n=1 Tax=Crateriforma conspicua TaxID=2527996 RepID=A0A5C6FV96_9PLAN|nr:MULTISPECIES: HAD-IA family hydrolase [Crateriforma]TWU66321.1 Phosphorylated carbohydrates phosphatase [Crateriforma conspicua]